MSSHTLELRTLLNLVLLALDNQKGIEIMSDNVAQMQDTLAKVVDDIASIQAFVTTDRAARDAIDVQLRADLAQALTDVAAGKLLETHVNELQTAVSGVLDKADAAKAALVPPPVITPPAPPENPPADPAPPVDATPPADPAPVDPAPAPVVDTPPVVAPAPVDTPPVVDPAPVAETPQPDAATTPTLDAAPPTV